MATMNEIYATLPVPQASTGVAPPAADEGLQALAQGHLDSAFMRREVTDLARALDDAAARQAALQQRLDAAEQALDALQQRHARLTQRLRRLLAWLPASWQARLIERERRALSD